MSEEELSKSICALWEELVSNKIAVNAHFKDQLEGLTVTKPGPVCLICEMLVSRLIELVDTKVKRNHMVHMFIRICDYMPNFIREPCHYIVHDYALGVLDLISKVSPHEVCYYLTSNLDILEELDNDFNEFLDTECALSTY